MSKHPEDTRSIDSGSGDKEETMASEIRKYGGTMAKKKVEYPADILEMSIDQLTKAERDMMESEEFDRLIAERDRAQAAVEAHRQRHAQILGRLTELLIAKRAERDRLSGDPASPTE